MGHKIQGADTREAWVAEVLHRFHRHQRVIRSVLRKVFGSAATMETHGRYFTAASLVRWALEDIQECSANFDLWTVWFIKPYTGATAGVSGRGSVRVTLSLFTMSDRDIAKIARSEAYAIKERLRKREEVLREAARIESRNRRESERSAA